MLLRRVLAHWDIFTLYRDIHTPRRLYRNIHTPERLLHVANINKLYIRDTDVTRCNAEEPGGSGDGSNSNIDVEITRTDITLPECFKGKLAFVLHHVFTKKECEDYIQTTENMGYGDILVDIGEDRPKLLPDVRNSTRCVWDSVEEADRFWQRIKQHIPDTWANRKAIGLNERLRFLRYNHGEYFTPHLDDMYMRENGERSYITVHVYLNEGFKGGSTTFMNYAEKERIEVVPETGKVLVFQHDIMHEGSVLIKGRKYSVRTDVMYDSKKEK